ncbi:1,9-bis(guanidino)-5-aza-nonane synthase [Deinococcus yavapaiensis]|uniref:Deoxyhypusine synthase-like protein n=1 Tax=Deinococcus yavapaiensis KR-236 TaxID=694435 RepID=A0A318SGE7_9DEIO|nr:deoxyhypusine synthase [Deinococcus yavapaiensis]PYE55966.1 homospermidine synthase (spermidine-specific) [Deinococcus yavapaiensis KR-236]
MSEQQDFLRQTVEHLDIKQVNVVPLIEMMGKTAFQARNLARAAEIFDEMVNDTDCGVILTLAGSMVSAGQREVILDLLRANAVDAIVSTGANIVDQDFFEALGYRHYQGDIFANDDQLRRLHIDRIYDTYINEDELRVTDDTTRVIADSLAPGAYSSREFIREMGRYLVENGLGEGSIVRTAYELDIPIFVPAFSDCSAGFGLVAHQVANPDAHVSIDSAKDFRELTELKVKHGKTGLFMLGGGVPKNFVQDVVVSAEFLGYEDIEMHAYAVQLTVADERDGALSGSTLKEANSWGKVSLAREQMVYGEMTVTFPLIAGYVWHKRNWEKRTPRRWAKLIDGKFPVKVAQ